MYCQYFYIKLRYLKKGYTHNNREHKKKHTYDNIFGPKVAKKSTKNCNYLIFVMRIIVGKIHKKLTIKANCNYF